MDLLKQELRRFGVEGLFMGVVVNVDDVLIMATTMRYCKIENHNKLFISLISNKVIKILVKKTKALWLKSY